MIEIKVNRKNLIAFLEDIKKEDLIELKEEMGNNYKKEFINLVLRYKCFCYFLGEREGVPIAIGGFRPTDKKENAAIIWLLSTNKAKKYKKELYKYIVGKIKIFKRHFSILYNCIYKTNFKSLKWLKRNGFKVKKLENKNYKLFYYKKGEKN